MTEAGRSLPDASDTAPAIDVLPDAYAEWRRSTLGRITDALEERLLLDRIGPVRGLRILDVGCGDGVLATRLAQDGARVTGLDASPAMIAAARRRAKAAGVEIDLVEGDSGGLPFPAGHFDRVVSVATLCFVDDPRPTIRDMVRVLKPGGRLILGELGRWNLWAAQRRVKGWLGSKLWRAAHFRSRADLNELADQAWLRDAAVVGAVYYPPIGIAAHLMARVDHMIGNITTIGGAFLVLTATSPAEQRVDRQRIFDGAQEKPKQQVVRHERGKDVTRKTTNDWLAAMATAFSLIACYGTLAAIAVLGALGVTIALNEAIWAGAIVFFAALALVTILLRWRRHRQNSSIVLAGIGFLLIAFTMVISYERIIELAGFAFLCAGTFVDWRIGREKK